MVIKATRKRNWFAYFSDNYRWSFITSIALMRTTVGASDPSEIFEVCRKIENSNGSDRSWTREWTKMGEKIRKLAMEEKRKKHFLSASSHFNRACHYFQMADRFAFPKNKVSNATYKKSIDCFQQYTQLTDAPKIECVEIPFEGKKTLPAYFIHAQNTRREKPPVVLSYTGFDGTKETSFVLGGLALARRGMSVVVPDTPGVGESIRFRKNFLRYDYEVAATAIIDWLEKRTDVNAKKVGIMASSLGGYYSPRSASMEKRIKACVAWGAIWDYHRIWKKRIDAAFKIQLPSPGNHLAWSFNVKTAEQGLEKLKNFKLDGIVQKMKCPFLIVHGEDDQQIPLSDAKKLYSASGSKDKTLKIFNGDNGGSQHCHMDYLAPVVPYMADWIYEKLS